MTTAERFEAKVERIPFLTCWTWIGASGDDCYGRFWWNKRQGLAHRYAYETYVGQIPSDKVIDHLCRNHSCVNPDHLRVITNKENVLIGTGISANNHRKTHCSDGHLLSGDNMRRNKYGFRICRTCYNRWMKEMRLRSNAALKTQSAGEEKP